MDKPPFKRVEELFHEARALPPRQRSAFLDAACAGDAALRSAVEDLLCVEEGRTFEGFLESPLAAAAAQLRAEAPTLATADTDRPAALAPKGVAGYEILEELGRGGMGVVYKARQVNLGRIVALKMLLPADAAAPEMLARFRTEVEALARLRHPNIITIFDIGEFEGRPYFTMEYVAGPSLDRLLHGRSQDAAGSARLIETLARTMHAVHQQDIIHRDLKPANILLQIADGGFPLDRLEHGIPAQIAISYLQAASLKITDFGLAKDRAALVKLTQPGLTMGTPCYMAPEQAKTTNTNVGPATDIYALGSVLYEMLTGRSPFEGGPPADIITRLLNDEPLSPRQLRPDLPRDLVTICMKCLEKTPHKRYASAWDLAEDLRRFQAGEPIRARAVSWAGRTWRWCRRRPLVAGLGCLSSLLAAILVATVLLYNASLQDALVKAEVKTEQQRRQIVQLDINIGFEEAEHGEIFKALVRFAEALRLDDGFPDVERRDRTRIAALLRQCPRLLQLRVADRLVLCTHLGPDGGWMASVGPGNVLEVKDVMTNRPVGPALSLDDAAIGGAISPDGRSMVTISSKATRVWDLTSGTSRLLPVQANQAVGFAVFHPESQVLLTKHADSTIRLWDLTAKQLDVPQPLSGGPVQHAALSDDARWLLTIDANRVARVWQLATGKVMEMLRLDHDVARVALGPKGRRMALLGADHLLRTWDVKASRQLDNPIVLEEAVSHVAFSPDGERVVTIGGKQGTQVWHVPTGERLFSPTGSPVTLAHFSPDSRLVVTTLGLGGARIWDTATGLALTPPLRHGGLLAAASFRADGKQVITVSRRGTVAVWEIPSLDQMKDDSNVAPDNRPIADLIKLAQVLACERIDEGQQWQALETQLLAAYWESLLGKR